MANCKDCRRPYVVIGEDHGLCPTCAYARSQGRPPAKLGKHNRFSPEISVLGQKGGTITCSVCGEKTRDTGNGEADSGMCRFCNAKAEQRNCYYDRVITKEQLDKVLAQIEEQRVAWFARKNKKRNTL